MPTGVLSGMWDDTKRNSAAAWDMTKDAASSTAEAVGSLTKKKKKKGTYDNPMNKMYYETVGAPTEYGSKLPAKREAQKEKMKTAPVTELGRDGGREDMKALDKAAAFEGKQALDAQGGGEQIGSSGSDWQGALGNALRFLNAGNKEKAPQKAPDAFSGNVKADMGSLYQNLQARQAAFNSFGGIK